MKVLVETDGGSRGNPGPAGYGAVVLDPDSGTVLAERSEFLGTETNNVAEYRGLIAGLTAARELGATEVAVRMDSKLVIEQMAGRWQVKHPSMRPLAREAAALRRHFDEVSFEWIPRARNKRADRLANEAMDRGQGVSSRRGPSTGSAVRAETAETAVGSVSAATAQPSGVAPGPASRWTPPEDETPTRLLLLRHGSTAHSAERRFSGRNDLPLNAAGSEQAAALAARVHALGTAAAVVSSPLLRARQTAEAVAATAGVPVETNDALAELDFGKWEGLRSDEAAAEYPQEFAQWLTSPDVAPPDGESIAAAAHRVRRGRDAVIAAHPGQTVVVVTHVTPIKILVRLVLGAPASSLFRMYLDTASVSVLDYFADGNSSLRLFNDTSHLHPGTG